MHHRYASDKQLIFPTITYCYGNLVTVFAFAIAVDDSIKYQSFAYGSFVGILKGTATLTISMFYQKELYKP